MPHDRYFSEEDLIPSKHISLTRNELHHLQHVMRKKEGDLIELVNGRNVVAKAKIVSLSSQEALVEILSTEIQEKPPFSLYLAQSWILPAKLDWVLEKGCELGVTEFFFFPSAFSAKHSQDSRKERMQTLLISSIKQCGRLDLPKISIYPDLSSFSSLSATFLFGDLRKETPLLKDYLKDHPLKKTPCLFIGPEKGFSAEELLLLEDTLHATGIYLHSNILRSETAAITGLSLLAHHLL